jgi:dTDP-4-dehydrorhamnose reductase
MDVLIIGGSGLVGQNVMRHCMDAGHSVVGTYGSSPTDETTVQLDKTDADRTEDVIEQYQPDAVIDAAAFHAVDDCETDRRRAWEVNAAGTANAAAAANRVDAHFVYLSTDYVFGGDKEERRYSETNAVAPVNYYGQTKYAAEQAAKITDISTILRPSVVYGLASDNFLTWVLSELRASNEINIVDDQISCPTYAVDIARTCIDVVERSVTGVYHAAGPSSVSRYEFTTTIAEQSGHDTDLITPISSSELGQEAPRPVDSSLDSTKLYEAIGYRFRPPAEALAHLLSGE